ncbi:ABC transporter substrate-binding protein [Knoellia flava TL1]|uniref:Glutamate-binding protein n=2 Tax=Knoellia flava TaxID=913969 RepID=A0A8H9FQC5_9MICO|nr:glutamate ABC transporter substrate-binding protein [Knoellia flava]KGN35418.1 ABC transporter substrate-binding protein [Knoellia flava TL1]MDT0215452.1 glutamate ABC transporter substrate-binding protein [Rothia sp. ARF10]GGB69049.1 glutamate-binding protein [Knoellia flava]
MKVRQIGAVLAASVLTLGLAACGDSANDSDSGSGGDASGGTGKAVKIGIKFDQPGLGLKQGEDYTGLDVDVAKYVAKELGSGEGDITWVQAPSAQRETLISTGQVDMIFATYSITDKRKETVSFAGPYFIAGQDLLVRGDDSSITGPETLTGKKLCSVTGSTSAQKVKDKYPGVQLQEFGTYSECVAALVSKGVDALTTDNTILAGYASQEQYKGKLKVVGKTFSEERYGVGIKKGDTALCEKINTALTKMVDSGDWQKAVDANLGPAGFKVDTAVNPPKPDACS